MSLKVPFQVFVNAKQACQAATERISQIVIHSKKKSPTVLGLATGASQVELYHELVRRYREEGLDLSQVITFNLDEFWPLESNSSFSYQHWMNIHFFDHVNIPRKNIHMLCGMVSKQEVIKHCEEYESAIRRFGGIDLQFLGIGRTGHVAFNEPGSFLKSRTRLVSLHEITRKDLIPYFLDIENLPRKALTMGIQTILEAKEIILFAFGAKKADIVRRALEGEISEAVPASFLQKHPRMTAYFDQSIAKILGLL